MGKDDEVQFRGGRQSKRDRNFGVTDREFWRWWHQHGKREMGQRDISGPEAAQDAYEIWVSEGRPKAR